MFFNSFYTLVFVKNKSLRLSPLYYFGILAILDIILAINYILLMSVPVSVHEFWNLLWNAFKVYFDQFGLLWLYHLFLGYLVPMMTISNTAMFGSMLLIFMATVERLLRTSKSPKVEAFRQWVSEFWKESSEILDIFGENNQPDFWNVLDICARNILWDSDPIFL